MPDVAALRRIEVGSRALAARDLGGSGFTSGEFEEIARVGWMVEVAVEPPLVKGVIDEGSHRSVIVRVRLIGHIKPVHARVEERCAGDHQ